MIVEALEKILQRQELDTMEAAAAMEEILVGEATETQTAAFLVALSMRGETAAELLGMARALRGKSYLFSQYGPVELGVSNSEHKLLAAHAAASASATFNISSAVAFVVAGSGVHLLQQGYRSTDGSLESAAVLEALGIETHLPAWKIARGVGEVGVGFVFEPVISEVMARLVAALRQIPVPTALDLTLPLLNPGNAPAVVIGAHSDAILDKVASVVSRLGARRAFIFHGSDGLDQITNTGPTRLVEVIDGDAQAHTIQPGDFGLPLARLEELSGGDAARNASIIRAVLSGESGARRNTVLLNAAPCVVCAGKAATLREGIEIAARSIDSGAALRALDRLAEFTRGR